jgi:hypothetical protein
MNCDHIKPSLPEYVMDELAGAERAEIARHLENCTACFGEKEKIQQTLGLLTKAAAFEDVPQRIRIVAERSAEPSAEPSDAAKSWVLAFWRNPARLAFAASGLSCVAIAALALAHTTITIQQGNFEIAFGAAARSAAGTPLAVAGTVRSPAAASLPIAPIAATQSLTREEIAHLIEEAVAASEARQSASTARVMEASAHQAKADRINDRINDQREMAESFRYVQATQVNMWKQQVESQQMLSALVQRSGIEQGSRP